MAISILKWAIFLSPSVLSPEGKYSMDHRSTLIDNHIDLEPNVSFLSQSLDGRNLVGSYVFYRSVGFQHHARAEDAAFRALRKSRLFCETIATTNRPLDSRCYPHKEQ